VTVKNVADRTSVVDVGAAPATKGATAKHQKVSGTITTPLSVTTPDITTNILNGIDAGKSGSEPAYQPNSGPLVKQPSGSNEPWQMPTSVGSFAAQVNAVATAVLNGEVFGRERVEAARLYSNLARTVVQAVATEVQIARLVGRKPSDSLTQSDKP
jgi:hypothetical protein